MSEGRKEGRMGKMTLWRCRMKRVECEALVFDRRVVKKSCNHTHWGGSGVCYTPDERKPNDEIRGHWDFIGGIIVK
jgi:hypothetical protein